MNLRRLITVAASTAALVLVAAGCGGGDGDGGSGGTITADGSSTVGPFTTKAAEDFKAEGGVDVTVGISGTGGGFERFCRGETDLSNASRPIKDEEAALCADEGIEFLEFEVAADALTNVVNQENDWAACLTVEQLKAIWEPGSKVENWNQVDPSFPDVPLRLYGAGTDSGTFDYFTDVIVGEEGASRTDYNASEDDNVTVQGVSGERGGLGYFGFSYFEENQDTLKAVEVDGGSGCVAASVASAQDGSYTPLSRPLFVYVKKSSFDDNQDVRDFVEFMLDNEQSIAEAARFVPLSAEQLAEQQAKFEDATS
jgi:phosphate transport system substrate-binding protein